MSVKPRITDSFYRRYEPRSAKPTEGFGDANPLCPGCNLRRTAAEFRGTDGEPRRYCRVCRDRRPELRRVKG